MSRAFCQWLPVVVGILVAIEANAAGFWNLDQGVSSYARGGTNIAAPQDPLAIYTNPAALPGVKGLQFLIEADMPFDMRTFERAPDSIDFDGDGVGDFDRTYEKVENEFVPFPPSPGVFVTYNFASLGLEDLTVGAAAFGPPRAHSEFPEDGAQRYSQISNYPLQIHYTLAAGYELPWAGIRLGASLYMLSQIFDTTLALSTSFDRPLPIALEPEDTDYDAIVHAKASDHLIPVPTFALSAEPVDGFIIAATFRLPWDVEAEGTAEVTLGKRLGREIAGVPFAQVTGEDLIGYLNMPAVLRVAAMYRDPEDRFDAELAFVWEGWSRNEQIVFDPLDIAVTIPSINDPNTGEPINIALDDIVIDTRYRDTYSIRAGGKYRLAEIVLLRAGVYYERAAVGGGRLSLGTFDLDKIGVTAGGRIDLPFHLWVDLAVGYVQFFTKETTTSKTLLKNPLAVPPEPRWPMANGTYGNRQIVTMLGVGGHFDL